MKYTGLDSVPTKVKEYWTGFSRDWLKAGHERSKSEP